MAENRCATVITTSFRPFAGGRDVTAQHSKAMGKAEFALRLVCVVDLSQSVPRCRSRNGATTDWPALTHQLPPAWRRSDPGDTRPQPTWACPFPQRQIGHNSVMDVKPRRFFRLRSKRRSRCRQMRASLMAQPARAATSISRAPRPAKCLSNRSRTALAPPFTNPT